MTVALIISNSTIVRQLFTEVLGSGVPDVQISAVLEGEPHELEVEWPEHSRSVSWIMEDLILRYIEENVETFGISNFERPTDANAPHDIRFDYRDRRFYVNIKVHKSGNAYGASDLGAVEGLLNYYAGNQSENHPNYSVINVILDIEFDGSLLRFSGPENFIVLPIEFASNPGWGDLIYLNAGTGGVGKLQARYDCPRRQRTRTLFIRILRFYNQGNNVTNPDNLSHNARRAAILANWQLYLQEN